MNDQLSNINQNDKLVIEEETFTLRGYLQMSQQKFKDENDKMNLLERAPTLTYKKLHFSFLDDVLICKNKHTSAKPQLKIFLTTIDEIGAEDMNYIYFVRKETMFILDCEEPDVRKRWIRALIFLREQSLEEVKGIKFEQFEVGTGKMDMYEGAKALGLNYGYEEIQIGEQKPQKRQAFEFNEELTFGEESPNQDQVKEVKYEEEYQSIEKSIISNSGSEEKSTKGDNTTQNIGQVEAKNNSPQKEGLDIQTPERPRIQQQDKGKGLSSNIGIGDKFRMKVRMAVDEIKDSRTKKRGFFQTVKSFYGF